jgi:predicted NAD-dependent protein-ADP-ribosyltransferase YbiA (DUF1768 family)
VKGAIDPLSNFFPFDMDCDGIHSKSVEHVLQFVRAADCGKLTLARQIWNAADAPEVKRLVKRNPLPSRPEFDIPLMRHLLEIKFEQCTLFRDALRDSGDAMLLHSTYASDRVWATGLNFYDVDEHKRCMDNGCSFPGENVHGLLLTELRTRHFGSNCCSSRLPSLLDSLVTAPTQSPSVAVSAHLHQRTKPPSLLDVNVDMRLVMPWFVKHGYCVPSVSVSRPVFVPPFRRVQASRYRV